MQKRESKETVNSDRMNEAKEYYDRFGLSCVFGSTGPHDLRTVWGSDLGMPPELYPLLVELAEKEATEVKRDFFIALQDEPKSPMTPEEEMEYQEEIQRLRDLSPREFWANGEKIVDDFHRATGETI